MAPVRSAADAATSPKRTEPSSKRAQRQPTTRPARIPPATQDERHHSMAAGEQPSVQLIDHLKKGDMAREAERLLDGTGWLPEPLRLPDIDDAQQGPAADVAALPEFLAEDDEVAADADEDRPQIIAAE